MSALRRRLPVVLAPAMLAGVIASDFIVLPSFWREHAMTAGLVSGVVLLLIGLAVVDQVVESRDARRWQTAAFLGFKSLGGAIEEALDNVLYALSGVAPPYGSRPPMITEAAARELHRPGTWPPTIDRASLRALMADDERRDRVERALVAARFRLSDGIAKWLPAFISVGRLAETAEEVAQFHTLLGSLQYPVSELRKTADADRPAAVERWTDDLVMRVNQVFATGNALRTQLYHDAKATWFTPESRHLVEVA